MRLFKTVLKNTEAGTSSVMEYVPVNFEMETPEPAVRYIELTKHEATKDFHMADVIRVQTGVAEIEELSLSDQIEGKVLEKLKVIEESAYKEAYQLGLDEGRKEAFEKKSEEIELNLKNLEDLINNMLKLKIDLIDFNEAHIIQLIYYMASRIAMTEISEKNDAIVTVIKQAAQLAQDEQQINVQVSDKEFEFLESLKKESKKDLEFLKKIHLESSTDIQPGGCIVETNYGIIDARIEERVNKLWSSIKESIPRTKDKIRS